MNKINDCDRLKNIESKVYKEEVTTQLFNELRGAAFQRYEKCQKQALTESFKRGYEKGFIDGLKYKA